MNADRSGEGLTDPQQRLFTEAQRTSAEDRGVRERLYAFLERSSEDDAAGVRRLLQEWYAAYPTDHRKDMRGRLIAGDDEEFMSAFYELYLFRVLTLAGCGVTVHPALDFCRPKHPDFLIREPDGSEYILEACVSSGRSADDQAAQNRMDALEDTLHRMRCDYHLSLTISGPPPHAMRTAELVQEIRQYISSLNFDEVEELSKGDKDNRPRRTFTDSGTGWTMHVAVASRPREYRGLPGSVFSVGTLPECVDSITPVRTAIEKKAKRYWGHCCLEAG